MAGGRTTRVYPGPCGCCGGGCGCPACGGTLPQVLHVTFERQSGAYGTPARPAYDACRGLWPDGIQYDAAAPSGPVTLALTCTGSGGQWSTGVTLCRYTPRPGYIPAPEPGQPADAYGTVSVVLTCDPGGGGGFRLEVGGVAKMPPGGASSQYDWALSYPDDSEGDEVYRTGDAPATYRYWRKPAACSPFVWRAPEGRVRAGGGPGYWLLADLPTGPDGSQPCCVQFYTLGFRYVMGRVTVTL